MRWAVVRRFPIDLPPRDMFVDLRDEVRQVPHENRAHDEAERRRWLPVHPKALHDGVVLLVGVVRRPVIKDLFGQRDLEVLRSELGVLLRDLLDVDDPDRTLRDDRFRHRFLLPAQPYSTRAKSSARTLFPES